MDSEENNTQRSFWVTYPSRVLFDERLNSTDIKVYAIISSFSNNKDGFCYLNYKQLAKISRIKKRQFYRIVRKLMNYEYIVQKKNKTRSYLMPNINQYEEQTAERKIHKHHEIFWYDWLNEEEE